ncbi:hypothetical protein DFH06DRAFT_1151252 [Mycena polygramma]|nr:hypothetical protein DFH06DRAFT_1151252 [Mycena polygramma]
MDSVVGGCVQQEWIKHWVHPASLLGGSSRPGGCIRGRGAGASRAAEGAPTRKGWTLPVAPTWKGGCIQFASTRSLMGASQTLGSWPPVLPISCICIDMEGTQLFWTFEAVLLNFSSLIGRCSLEVGYYPGGAGGRHLWWPGLGGNIYPASHTQVWGSHSHSTYSPRPTHSSNAATKQAASNPKKYENAAVHAGWGPIGAMSQVQTYGVGKCAVQAPKSKGAGTKKRKISGPRYAREKSVTDMDAPTDMGASSFIHPKTVRKEWCKQDQAFGEPSATVLLSNLAGLAVVPNRKMLYGTRVVTAPGGAK